jgi:hypothetical protein
MSNFSYYILSKLLPGQDPANITYRFEPPLELPKNYEVGITGGSIVASNPNILSAYGNNVFRYSNDNGTTWFNIVLPDGTYIVDDINTELHKGLKANGHYTAPDIYPINLSINLYLLRVVITLTTNYRVDFTGVGAGLGSILGFNSQIYTATENTAQNNGKISDRLRQYFVQTDIIKGGIISSENSAQSGILKVIPGGQFGFGLDLTPTDIQLVDFFPVKSNIITQINIKLLDGEFSQLDTRGEATAYKILFRPTKVY